MAGPGRAGLGRALPPSPFGLNGHKTFYFSLKIAGNEF